MTIKGKLNLIFDRTLTIPSIVKKKKIQTIFLKPNARNRPFPSGSYHPGLCYWVLIADDRLINPQNNQQETLFSGRLIQFLWCLMFGMSA